MGKLLDWWSDDYFAEKDYLLLNERWGVHGIFWSILNEQSKLTPFVDIITTNGPIGRKTGNYFLALVLFSKEKTFLVSFFVIKTFDVQAARKLM